MWAQIDSGFAHSTRPMSTQVSSLWHIAHYADKYGLLHSQETQAKERTVSCVVVGLSAACLCKCLIGKISSIMGFLFCEQKIWEKWYFELVKLFFPLTEKRFTLRRKFNRNRLFSLNDELFRILKFTVLKKVN